MIRRTQPNKSVLRSLYKVLNLDAIKPIRLIQPEKSRAATDDSPWGGTNKEDQRQTFTKRRYNSAFFGVIQMSFPGADKPNAWESYFGTPEGTRTPNPRNRNPMVIVFFTANTQKSLDTTRKSWLSRIPVTLQFQPIFTLTDK